MECYSGNSILFSKDLYMLLFSLLSLSQLSSAPISRAASMAAATAASSTPLSSSTQFTLLRRSNLPPSSSSLRFFPPFSSSSTISISASHSHALVFDSLLTSGYKRVHRVLAVAEEEKAVDAVDVVEEEGPEETRPRVRACELYVCNLPRSCDIAELLNIFNPYGTVQSVEISRDPETGISRGCGYVTVSSVPEAKAAIAALDGSDLGGREVRVIFSADIVSGRKNIEALNTAPKKDLVFESPHKVYVGNLAWSVRPEDLREHFSQFGSVVSTRVLYDRKGGKNRVYGFLSFSSVDELKAAIETSGMEFRGRTILVREVVNRE